MANIKYTISESNLHLINSYQFPKKQFDRQLNMIFAIHPVSNVWARKRWSLKFEWAVHNALYALGIKRDRTKDCDLNSPQKWYVNWAYNVLGVIVWPFIK